VPVFLSTLADYGGSAGGGMSFIWLILAIAALAGWWQIFTKAGQPGWAAIVPIYNIIIMLRITQKPLWWLILFFIPFVNLVAIILVGIEVAKRFEKSAAFGVGLALLSFIFAPMLGFGDASYHGPTA